LRIFYYCGYILKSDGISTVRSLDGVYNFGRVSERIDIFKSYNLTQIKGFFGAGVYDAENTFAYFAHDKPFHSSGRVCRSLP